MGIGFYLGAIKYIPYSIKNYKEMKNNKSRIDSYEEGKRRIQQHILPFFYVTVLATLIIPFLVIFALIYGFTAYKSIKVLKNIKMTATDRAQTIGSGKWTENDADKVSVYLKTATGCVQIVALLHMGGEYNAKIPCIPADIQR